MPNLLKFLLVFQSWLFFLSLRDLLHSDHWSFSGSEFIIKVNKIHHHHFLATRVYRLERHLLMFKNIPLIWIALFCVVEDVIILNVENVFHNVTRIHLNDFWKGSWGNIIILQVSLWRCLKLSFRNFILQIYFVHFNSRQVRLLLHVLRVICLFDVFTIFSRDWIFLEAQRVLSKFRNLIFWFASLNCNMRVKFIKIAFVDSISSHAGLSMLLNIWSVIYDRKWHHVPLIDNRIIVWDFIQMLVMITFDRHMLG